MSSIFKNTNIDELLEIKAQTLNGIWYVLLLLNEQEIEKIRDEIIKKTSTDSCNIGCLLGVLEELIFSENTEDPLSSATPQSEPEDGKITLPEARKVLEDALELNLQKLHNLTYRDLRDRLKQLES